MSSQKRLALGFLGVGLLLALSGCAQVTVHSTVTADETVEEYDVTINMSRQAYGYFENSIEEDGHESVRAYFETSENNSAVENLEFSQEFNGDEVTMNINIDNIDPSETESFTITKQDGNLTYVDRTFVNTTAQQESQSEIGESVTSGIAVDYYLTMPGEITYSNADSVDGKTAEWHESGREAYVDNRIAASSDVSTFSAAPGFGAGAAIVALLLAVSVAYCARK